MVFFRGRPVVPTRVLWKAVAKLRPRPVDFRAVTDYCSGSKMSDESAWRRHILSDAAAARN
jgi:hypothetical protein